MARVKVEGVLEQWSSEVRAAIRAAIEEVAPGSEVDAEAVHRAFRRALLRKCGTWHHLHDRYIQA